MDVAERARPCPVLLEVINLEFKVRRHAGIISKPMNDTFGLEKNNKSTHILIERYQTYYSVRGGERSNPMTYKQTQLDGHSSVAYLWICRK